MSRLGNSRNDGRKPRLPKDPNKAEREMRIREYAKNNGFSIATARIMLEDEGEETMFAEVEIAEVPNKSEYTAIPIPPRAENGASLQTVIAKLESLFKVFNGHFFDGELETPVIAVHPDTTKGAYGWCTTWRAWQGEKEGGYYEINMCAEHLSRPFEQTCGTLLHEMVHLKNLQDKIQDCSRSGKYHNKKFKDTAERYGLTVEKDAKYGWCRTKLTDDTIEWLKAEFPEEGGFTLHRDRKIKLTSGGKSSSSRKYVCPECGAIIRATKEVNVTCADCGVNFEER